jgi:mannose-6-phosphate isomerase-like protein (cupin superfamily)
MFAGQDSTLADEGLIDSPISAVYTWLDLAIPGGGPTMQTATHFLRRDPANVTPWAETCGQIRCLIEEKDGAAGEVHHVEIQDAKLHYHANTDEFYYIIDGQGTMTLDDEEIELHKGVVVYVPRGVKHKARGNLTVLTVCVPRGVLHDVHELE